MASPLCLRCLRRSLRSIEHTNPSRFAAFSTTSSLPAAPKAPGAKKGVVAKPGSRQGKNLVLSKNVRTTTGKPPAPGERKAIRKRIVLSNTNALEVQGLEDLTGDKLVTGDVFEGYEGKVLGLGNETVDALRALEAFKPRQGWSLFRRPASLVRRETVEVAQDLLQGTEDGEKRTVCRKIIFGPRSSGKSVLLLQAQAMAFVKDWVVIHFPEAREMVDAQTSYQPMTTPDRGIVYVQPHYTAKLLSNIAAANQRLLSSLKLSKQHKQLPIPIQPNMSLARFAELGARDPELAWPIFQALFSELTAPSQKQDGLQRPPVLVTMDGVDQAMRMSAYLDAEARSVHAHDLALVGWFMDLLSGQSALPNGGAVLAATCASNKAASPTLEHHLDTTWAQRESNPSSKLPTWPPYEPKDSRVDQAMQGVQALKAEGLSKEEAKGVMEYYAQSGILRGTVTEGLVSETWTLAGRGVVGEVERQSVGGLRF